MSIYDEIPEESIYSDNMPTVISEHIRDDELTEDEIKRYWKRAVKYIEGYTGLERERLEKLPDMVHALLAIVADMHDNRQLSVDKSYINQLVASVLDMYRENLV